MILSICIFFCHLSAAKCCRWFGFWRSVQIKSNARSKIHKKNCAVVFYSVCGISKVIVNCFGFGEGLWRMHLFCQICQSLGLSKIKSSPFLRFFQKIGQSKRRPLTLFPFLLNAATLDYLSNLWTILLELGKWILLRNESYGEKIGHSDNGSFCSKSADQKFYFSLKISG